jgi:CRP/FNR family cyclic AMP-dependent transcriptional regulator
MFRQELAQVSIFKGLSSADLDTLAPHFEAVCLLKNQVIFEQGKIADYLFILLEGEVVVNFKPYDGPSLTVAHILPGGIFGWSAALGRQMYTSTAIACCSSNAIRIKGEELRCLCEKHPATGVLILERLAGVIADRLQSTRAQIFAMLSESVDLNGCDCKEEKP